MDAGTAAATRAGFRTRRHQVQVGARLVVVEAGNQLTWSAETVKRMPEVVGQVVHPNEVKGITESRGKTSALVALAPAADHGLRRVEVRAAL